MEQQKYFHRQIDQALLAWKNSTRHKPLLLRGARQVGKSSTVRHLAEQFDNFVESKAIKQAVRTSLENFGRFQKDDCTIDIFPLYALRNLVQK